MGMYINPTDGRTKEEFLEEEGIYLNTFILPDAFDTLDKDDILVCLVDNGMFTAAAVCYNKSEFDIFRLDNSGRPMKWYFIERKVIIPHVEAAYRKLLL